MADISNLTPEQRKQIYEEEKRTREDVRDKIREEEEFRMKIRQEMEQNTPKEPVKNQKADAAYICALLSIFIGPIAGIPAIILGKMAQEEIEKNPHMEGLKKAKQSVTVGVVTTLLGLFLYYFMLSGV